MRRGDGARGRPSRDLNLMDGGGDAASRVSTEESLGRAGGRGSRGGFVIDRNQLDAAPRATAA
jgi:hypothetical protein